MKTKNTLYNDLFTLQNRSTIGINENLLFPLMRWLSGYEKNIPLCVIFFPDKTNFIISTNSFILSSG